LKLRAERLTAAPGVFVAPGVLDPDALCDEEILGMVTDSFALEETVEAVELEVEVGLLVEVVELEVEVEVLELEEVSAGGAAEVD